MFGAFCSSFIRTHTFAGPAEEENEQDEYECITGLLDELNGQMGRYLRRVKKGNLAFRKCLYVCIL